MELMKNGLSKPAIVRLRNALATVLTDFNKEAFEHECLNSLETLELKERVSHIISILHVHLPSDFIEASHILYSIKPIWDYGDPDDALKSFAAWPLVDYIAIYGLEHPQESLKLLKELTSLFSAEFAIRPFIIKYPNDCHSAFEQWVVDDSSDVRRLVSEGTRPKLPWGIQLKQFVLDPTPNIPLLNKLCNDSSLYVRRSVANHLNDIAKDHPAVVINTCKQWLQKPTKEIQWLIKHATRTLVKAGNKDVFPLLGYTENPQIIIDEFSLSEQNIKLGESISFNLIIRSNAKTDQSIVIDYAIHFMKANGKQQAKVFKCKNQKLAANESVKLSKSFSFKAITTRKYYSGKHKLEVLVNGISISSKMFTVHHLLNSV